MQPDTVHTGKAFPELRHDQPHQLNDKDFIFKIWS